MMARKFDWDEALVLRASGLSWQSVAERCGVSETAVRRILVPGEAERMEAYRANYQREKRPHAGVCPDCGGESSQGRYRKGSRCRACDTRHKCKSARDDTLRCSTCRLWLPDDQFPNQQAHVGKSRRGRHAVCRPCQNVARQLNREANRERERVYNRERRRRAKATP